MNLDQRQAAVERLQILDAVMTALDRREDLLRLVSESASADAAMARLQSEWGMSEVQAVCALDLQVRRFSVLERNRMTEERAQLVVHIDQLSR